MKSLLFGIGIMTLLVLTACTVEPLSYCQQKGWVHGSHNDYCNFEGRFKAYNVYCYNETAALNQDFPENYAAKNESRCYHEDSTPIN